MDNNNNNSNSTTKAAGSSNDPNHQESIVAKEGAASENVTFLDTPQTYALDIASGSDDTFGESGAHDSDFAGFLGRFVELPPIEWTLGTDLLEVIDPWELWMANNRIADKLKHFRYLRCELEVRFTVSGTPFHYGQLMAAYAPMLQYYARGFDSSVIATANKEKSTLYNFRHYLSGSPVELKETTDSYFSTHPHVLIVPGENAPVEMTLPFIWHNNYIRVNKQDMPYSDGATGRETPGSIVITDLVKLGRASDSASEKITVSIWARAKNIDLSMPTYATAASETMQASQQGFVSKFASATASAAQVVGKIPGMKPYAKATEVAATTIGSVAQLFGFSRPSDVSAGVPYSMNNGRNMALTNVADNSQKLTFDAHQEISVDSRVIGSDGRDDMAFENLTGRWWWCGKAPWTPTTTDGVVLSKGFLAAKPQLIYQCLVSPMMWRHVATTHTVSRNSWQMCPSGYLGNTFQYWRGGITFRIHVVASKFHQGRLKIQFDPYDGDPDHDDVESRYTWILDLQEANEIDITIPYAAFRGYLNMQEPAAHGLQDPEYSTYTTSTTQANFDEHKHMGFLSISKVNDLVAPNGANGVVYVSVWHKCADDVEFQVPGSEWHDLIIQATGSSEEEQVAESDEHQGTSSNEIAMWKSYEAPNRTLVWFGERVLSIRSLIKRFVYTDTLAFFDTSQNGYDITSFNIKHWPDVPETGWSRKNCYLSYFSPGFLAKRGSTRFKFYDYAFTGTYTAPTGHFLGVHVERKWSSTHVNNSASSTSIEGSSGNNAYTNNVAGGAAGGMVAGNDLGDNLIEVESPYYMNQRFQLGPWIDNGSMSPIDNGANYLKYTTCYNHKQNQLPCLFTMQAAGEDCSLMFFLAAPVLYSS